MKIGVLAAQGAFVEHIDILCQLKVDSLPVRLPRELAGLDGLIIPGGESTSISKLMVTYNLIAEVKDLAQSGLPIFGTCAGMILLASNISDSDVTPLGVMEITVGRNAFGRQRESFETELSIPVLGEKPFPAVFIRAPVIKQVNGKAEVLARLDDGTAVAARQGKLLVSAFHPELTTDLRFHQYFLDIVSGSRQSGG
jgi:5'-phosphate synthase pdxT subunit